jgi:hypothetical protein
MTDTEEMLERCKALILNPHWGKVTDPATTVIERVASTNTVLKGIDKLVKTAEYIVGHEANLVSSCDMLQTSAMALVENPYWSEVREGFNKYMVGRAAAGNIKPTEINKMQHCIDVLSRVVFAIERSAMADERKLRAMGLAAPDAPTSKTSGKRRPSKAKAHSTAGPKKGSNAAVPYSPKMAAAKGGSKKK